MDIFKHKTNYLQLRVSEATLLLVAKLLVVGAAIANLILSPTYVSALLKLENEICGFVMFLFILFGLVALFQATRYKRDHAISVVLNLLSLVLVIILGLYLASIFSDALKSQRTLKKPEDVQKAIHLCYVICSMYGIAFVLFVTQVIKEIRE